MDESKIQSFWNWHPCGDHIVSGLHGAFADNYERFFTTYGIWRGRKKGHIPVCLDHVDRHSKKEPGGIPVSMSYARSSWNPQLSIKMLRRVAIAATYLLRRSELLDRWPVPGENLHNAELGELRRYRAIDNFTRRNTDGPLSHYARACSWREAAPELNSFALLDAYSRYMQAPPISVRRLPAERWLGWHLRLHLRTWTEPVQTAPPTGTYKVGSP